MDNVIPLPVANSNTDSSDEAAFILRLWQALRGLPPIERERMVRMFELMALAVEIEHAERELDRGKR